MVEGVKLVTELSYNLAGGAQPGRCRGSAPLCGADLRRGGWLESFSRRAHLPALEEGQPRQCAGGELLRLAEEESGLLY